MQVSKQSPVTLKSSFMNSFCCFFCITNSNRACSAGLRSMIWFGYDEEESTTFCENSIDSSNYVNGNLNVFSIEIPLIFRFNFVHCRSKNSPRPPFPNTFPADHDTLDTRTHINPTTFH